MYFNPFSGPLKDCGIDTAGGAKLRTQEDVTPRVQNELAELASVRAAAIGLMNMKDMHSAAACTIDCVGMPANSKANNAVIAAAQALLADMNPTNSVVAAKPISPKGFVIG